MAEARSLAAHTPPPASGAARCRAKFLRQFPGGFRDATYLDWERDYKVEVHKAWERELGKAAFRALLDDGDFRGVATDALRIEQRARHSMLFSFEKMALRDAVRSDAGARRFAEGLYEYLHGGGSLEARFVAWRDTVAALPRRQTRVLTWPSLTVFGFLAQPKVHLFIKPKTMRRAAEAYGVELPYSSRPEWETYKAFLDLAMRVRGDLRDLRPRDMIDAQSFLWVQGSDEY
ncbi:MAG TPA: hypothetical protein VM370_11105 [Candidatus Thermoplasmatota archaeon]|nr:hypothetical protein [Candidatus Thermoplasmatota archaeon]